MRPVDVVRQVAKQARFAYVEAFENGDVLFREADITTPLRLIHFMAQALHETGEFTIAVENGTYTAEGISKTWHSRFPTAASAVAFAHNPEKLFNEVYANRMGNGPPESGDGFKFRGRGILQTTGRESYEKFSKRWDVDFVGNPALIYSAEHALKPAISEWIAKKCNASADKNDIVAVTKKINGGEIGLAGRKRWLRVVAPIITSVELKQ